MDYLIIAIIIILILFLVWSWWRYRRTEEVPVAKLIETEKEGFDDGSDDREWDELIAETEIDPSVYKSHKEFADGMNKYATTMRDKVVIDDDLGHTFTNYVGLSKPQWVPDHGIMSSIQGYDTDILKRNKERLILG